MSIRYRGCDVSEMDKGRRTALHNSVMNHNNPEVTRYLLEAFDLNVNATNIYGRTPLRHHKVKAAPSRCIRRLLLDHGALEDVNDRQHDHQVSRKRIRDNDDLESKSSPLKKQRP